MNSGTSLIVNPVKQSPSTHQPTHWLSHRPNGVTALRKQTAADPHGVALTQGGLASLEASLPMSNRKRFNVALPLRLIRSNSTLPPLARQSIKPPAASTACTKGVFAIT